MYENIRKIITHPGAAHRDEFLSICFVLAQMPEVVPIERHEPTEEEMADETVMVLDVGMKCQHELNNFDHHQLKPGTAVACCTLSILLQHWKMMPDAVEVFPWLTSTVILDACGPVAAAEHLGISREKFAETLSPIEVTLLRKFGKWTKIGSLQASLVSLMRDIGQEKLDYYKKLSERLQLLRRAKPHSVVEYENAGEVGRLPVLDLRLFPTDEDPTLGSEQYCISDFPQCAVVLSQTDRPVGAVALHRRNDDPRVDFRRLEGEQGVKFVHKGGFLAVVDCTGKAPGPAWIHQLVKKAIVYHHPAAK